MSALQAAGVALASGVTTIAVLWQPRWIHRLFARLVATIAALLYRGRHHHRTAPQPVTVSAIAARIRREAREAAHGWHTGRVGAFSIGIEPDVHPFAFSIRRSLERMGA